MNGVVFLRFVVRSREVDFDEFNINAIKNWPIPKSIGEVQRFYRLASLYRLFFKGFSNITTLLIKVIHKDQPFK